MKEETKKLYDLITDKLNEYFPENPDDAMIDAIGRDECEIMNLKDYSDQFTDNEFESALADLNKNRLTIKGMTFYGIKVVYHPDTMKITAKDIHVCDVEVKADRNRPYAYLKFCHDVVAIGKSKDHLSAPPYGVKLKAVDLEDYLYDLKCLMKDGTFHDNITGELIRYDPASVHDYYRFTAYNGKEVFFVRMTDALSRQYADAWDKDLIRYTPNICSSENSWGLTLATWQDRLVEHYNGFCFSDDLTETEVRFMTKYDHGSEFEKELLRHYNASTGKEDHSEDVALFAKKKATLQEIVTDHADEILSAAVHKIVPTNREVDDTTAELHACESHMGLDCGFIYFYFCDEASDDIAKNAAIYGSEEVFDGGSFWLNLPYSTQSTTIQRFMADEVIKLADQNGMHLGYRVQLD